MTPRRIVDIIERLNATADVLTDPELMEDLARADQQADEDARPWDEIVRRVTYDGATLIEERIKILLQDKPRWLPQRLWHAVLKRILKLETSRPGRDNPFEGIDGDLHVFYGDIDLGPARDYDTEQAAATIRKRLLG